MKKPFTLIGLTGLANAGKDTVADLLVAHAGFVKMAFADGLYAEVAEAFGVDVSHLHARETKEHPLSALALRRCVSAGFVGRMLLLHPEQQQVPFMDAPRSPRQILQWWGTEYRRAETPHYWTARASVRINFQMRARLSTRFVLTDCRFQNEVHMVRQQFAGQIWQIKRAGVAAPTHGHISESDGDAYGPDCILANDHSIKHLQQLVLAEYWAADAGLHGVKVEIAA